MSDENKLDILRTTDLNSKESDELQKFIEDGTPGLHEADKDKTNKMFEMYLLGKTYTQISGIMRLPRPVVLFVAHKCNWFPIKQEFLVEFENTKQQRLIEAKMMSQEFLITAQQAFNKKYSSKMNSYLAGNDEAMNDMDWKGYDRYLKTMERLEKVTSVPGENQRPLIGLNIGGAGVDMKRTGQNEIEITPKEKATENMLKYYADLNREKNKKK